MKKVITTIVLGFFWFFYASYLQAAPIQLSKADFISQTSGLSVLVEDFESYTPGFFPDPFVFTNGTYHGAIGGFVTSSTTFCSDGDQCLTNGAIDGIKTFDAFPIGTAYWGTYIDFINLTNTFDVTAFGGSGALNFQFSPTANAFFLGFYDSLGITSINIENLGTSGIFGNYSFDDITTATAPVPEPATMLLLGSGLIGLVGIGRRKKLFKN